MGRWHQMAERYGEWLGALYNRNIRETLKSGVKTLVANTQMDSGRAAAHWMIVPNKGGRPGSYAQMNFPNPDYGQGPVGRRGDNGRNRGKVIKAVVEREWSRAISNTVKGRNPATRFVFESSVPEIWDDSEKDSVGDAQSSSYRVNAKLAEAEEAAKDRMAAKFNALVEANKHRVNVLR